jgi:antitoxin component HigA of HigAB toxin-antitoxin module
MIKETTYKILMEEIEVLMDKDPAKDTQDGQLLNAMATIVELYEIEKYGRLCDKIESGWDEIAVKRGICRGKGQVIKKPRKRTRHKT